VNRPDQSSSFLLLLNTNPENPVTRLKYWPVHRNRTSCRTYYVNPRCYPSLLSVFNSIEKARIYYIDVQHVYLILDHQPSFQSSQSIRYDLYVSSSHRRFATPYGSPIPKFNRSVRVVPPEVVYSRSLIRPL
jgi:hypothetical protein